MAWGNLIRGDGSPLAMNTADLVDGGAVIWCGTSTGAANAYQLSPYPKDPNRLLLDAYSTGLRFQFIAHQTNAGTPTLAVYSNPSSPTLLATKSIVGPNNAAIEAGDIITGNVITVVDTGSVFQIIDNGVPANQQGWIAIPGTWTYASAQSVTVPSGATSLYQVSDKIRLFNNSVFKYFYVVGVAATTLTLAGDSLNNSAITNQAVSRLDSPFGFPGIFDAVASPIVTAPFTYTATSQSYYTYTVNSRRNCHCTVNFTGTTGGVLGGVITFTLPIRSAVGLTQRKCVLINNAGNVQVGMVTMTSGATSAILQVMNGVAWSAGANSGLNDEFTYEIAA